MAVFFGGHKSLFFSKNPKACTIHLWFMVYKNVIYTENKSFFFLKTCLHIAIGRVHSIAEFRIICTPRDSRKIKSSEISVQRRTCLSPPTGGGFPLRKKIQGTNDFGFSHMKTGSKNRASNNSRRISLLHTQCTIFKKPKGSMDHILF
jgi:hypothetical protein